jgi:hypothetical protein
MSANAPQQLDPGALVGGRFRVVKPLGQGGAAVVYEARDERSGRRLALKRLQSGKPSSDIAGQSALFEREYHTLRQLAHPRIVAVFDYGVEDAVPYYTMELLDGLDLHTLGRQPWRRACALLCDVASSLAVVHSRRLVHRDLSARNVRCTSDGRAKLIDFGALCPMGSAKHVVGTPPYAAPEAVERQGLDGRADLYGLGALAYWLLTGYHAYHARSFQQLRSMWRSPPLAPSQYQADVPPALDELVLQLLQLERAGRPTAAAEVMERLSGIAGLPLAELPEVQRSYLVMPSLVGRDRQLDLVRERLQRSFDSARGSAVCIEGEPGVGRSRLLQACILEAQLLGMLVVRGDASDSGRGGYGLIQALCAQLWEDAPDLCAQAALGREAVLRDFLPALTSPDAVASASHPAFDANRPAPRKQLQPALRGFLLAVARHKPLAIGVDDMERIDEPSAALLGLIAHAAPQAALVLVATHRLSAEPPPALVLIRRIGLVIELPAIQAEHTEALLRSVFGDVEYATALASRIHGLARGNPRWTMMLAEHLVERGLARYEAGSWALSPDVYAHDLPETLSDALSARAALLEPDARELAQALALTDPSRIAVEGYALLPERTDPARTYRALDQLISSGVLIAEDQRFRFSQPELAQVLSAGVIGEHARGVHARIAAALAGCDDRLLLAHHMLLGGLEREAVELLPPRFSASESSFEMCSKRALDILQRALAAARALGAPPELQLRLQSHIVVNASLRGDLTVFSAYAPDLLARLVAATGLPVPCAAVQCAGSAHAATRPGAPGSELGLQPEEAALLLGRVCGAFNAMAVVAMSPALLDDLPSLQPLARKFAIQAIMDPDIERARSLLAGDFGRAQARTREVLDLFGRLDPHQLDPSYTEHHRRGLLYAMGLSDASLGKSTTGEWLVELRHQPGIRAHAARVRMVHDLMHGNIEAANAWRQRAELLSLQDGELVVLPGTTARIELLAFVYADNLLGVKRTVERLEPLAALYPGWRATLSLGRAHYRRLTGDIEGALVALEPALRDAVIGRHMEWALTAGTHIGLQSALGQRQRALELAARYYEMNECRSFAHSLPTLWVAISEAFANAGQLERGRAIIDTVIGWYRGLGAAGLPMGMLYEAAARIAIKAQDRELFTRQVRLCAKEYRCGSGSALNGKLSRLLHEASEQGLSAPAELLQQPA